MKKIVIKTKTLEMAAELNSSRTASLIYSALPFKASAERWGDEIYFDIPVKAGLENGKEIVEKGELGYWPRGNAFCIFFGSTPISSENEIKPASAVSPVGKILGNPEELKKVSAGELIRVEKAG